MAEYNGNFSDVSAIDLGVLASVEALRRSQHRAGRDRSRHLRQRPPDLRRRDLRRAPRGAQGRRPEGDPGPDRQSPLRLGIRVHRPGRPSDPARRGEDGPGGRDGEHVPGAPRHPRRAQGTAARAGTARGLADGGAARFVLRPVHGPDVGPRRGEVRITRAEQDAYALSSQQRAAAAWAACRLSEEVVAGRGQGGQKDDPRRADDHLRPDTTLEGLAALPPSFGKDGSVTAGNASGIVDGAAAVVVTTAENAKAEGSRAARAARILGGRGRASPS